MLSLPSTIDDAVPDLVEVQYSALRTPHSALPIRAALWIAVTGLLAALAWPMLAGRVYLADDLGAFHLPLRSFYAQQLARGEPFDWCPELYCGFYLTGEGQVGAYHPLHWLLYRCLPLSLAFDLECWLSYPLMLVGMYVLLRRWRLPSEAALLGGMAFTFGGFNLLHFVHPNGIAVVAHLPWLLVAIDVLMRSPSTRYRRLAFVAVALLTGSQFLLGYPQYVLFSLFVEALYVASFMLADKRSNRTDQKPRLPLRASPLRLLATWLASVILGALVAGIQLLPTLDALHHSARQTAEADFAAQGSLYPLNIVQLVAPYLFATRVVGQNTHELGLYAGAVTIVMAVYALLCVLRRWMRRSTVAALALAVLGLLWAFGQFGPLTWIQANFPLINSFRFPCRAIVVFQLGLAVLAAIGFAQILRAGARARREPSQARLPRALWLLPLASVAVSIIGALAWRDYLAPWPLVLSGPLFIAAATALVLLGARGARWAIAILVILAAVDLGVYGLSHSIVGRTQSLTEFVGGIDVPPGPPSSRAAVDLIAGSQSAPLPAGQRVGDEILLRGWKRVDGYAGLEPARRLDYRDPAALRVAGTGWISHRALREISPHAVRSVTSDSAEAKGWIPLAGYQPRAWLVTRTHLATNPAIDISRIDLASEALVDRPLEFPSAPAGVATPLVDRPGNILVATEAATPQLLVVGEGYHRGWRASVDGQHADVLQANGDFLGIAVPAGRHEITLQFDPQSLGIGRWASGFGLGLIVVTLAAPAAVRRRAATLQLDQISSPTSDDATVRSNVAPADFRFAH